MSTKILALCDALGNLVRFVLMPGQRHDSKGVQELIDGIEFGALLADKAFDANWLIEELEKRGAQVVISQMPGRCELDDVQVAEAACEIAVLGFLPVELDLQAQVVERVGVA